MIKIVISYLMSMTRLVTYVELVGGKINVRSPQNTLLERGDKL